LVGGLKRLHDFEVSVAAYPEVHPDSRDRTFDLENLKKKVDAGADRAITQFFFSADCFFRFRDEAASAGIDVEIVPGILPVSNVATTRRFAASCGAAIPKWLDDLFEGLDDLPAARQLIAATVAAELCGQLYAGGVRHFHFYTLNRAELSYAICHLLGVRANA
ncbi:MAG TPA: methylenetetrahydrofolate reductase, partial [Sphingomicrobium sp.]